MSKKLVPASRCSACTLRDQTHDSFGACDTAWLHQSDAHGGEVCAGIVSGLIGPNAPETERWETLWHYMQGGPAQAIIMSGMGHFPMSEDPALFLEYLHPVLAKIGWSGLQSLAPRPSRFARLTRV